MIHKYFPHQKLILGFTLLYLGAGLLFLLLPREIFPAYIHHPRFLALTSLLAPFCILAPRILISSNSPKKKAANFELELAIATAFFINGAGELGLFELYQYGLPYDKFAHFFVSLMFAYVLGLHLRIRTSFSIVKIFTLVFIAIFSLGLLWECTEAGSDLLFHTRLWGMYGTFTTEDTLSDIFANTGGILLSLIFLFVYYRKWPQNIESKGS